MIGGVEGQLDPLCGSDPVNLPFEVDVHKDKVGFFLTDHVYCDLVR